MKHTPEPWDYRKGIVGDVICQKETRQHCDKTEDCLRAIACVNACAGIEDPAKEIPALIESNRVKDEQIRVMEKLLKESKLVLEYFQDGPYRDDEGDQPVCRSSISKISTALSTASKLTGGK